MSGIVWPLYENVIRGRSVRHTFGMVRRYPDGRPKPHQGWDFEADTGTPLYSIAEGEVVLVRNLGDYGLQMCASFDFDGATYYAFYAHLQTCLPGVGDKLGPDDLIGSTGISGNARNLPRKDRHLHFEIRTQAHAGRGLAGRVSPRAIFGACPLTSVIYG
jgi:murein DD-endopeptidase MepM/ murein hydrolase activator NlpD